MLGGERQKGRGKFHITFLAVGFIEFRNRETFPDETEACKHSNCRRSRCLKLTGRRRKNLVFYCHRLVNLYYIDSYPKKTRYSLHRIARVSCFLIQRVTVTFR
ncbi:hypothetical protein V6Z12_D03G208900 [Gossypium hirsutum]